MSTGRYECTTLNRLQSGASIQVGMLWRIGERGEGPSEPTMAVARLGDASQVFRVRTCDKCKMNQVNFMTIYESMNAWFWFQSRERVLMV